MIFCHESESKRSKKALLRTEEILETKRAASANSFVAVQVCQCTLTSMEILASISIRSATAKSSGLELLDKIIRKPSATIWEKQINEEQKL